jgi:hypothetical protein
LVKYCQASAFHVICSLAHHLLSWREIRTPDQSSTTHHFQHQPNAHNHLLFARKYIQRISKT